jgi:hypothetical protein
MFSYSSSLSHVDSHVALDGVTESVSLLQRTLETFNIDDLIF